MLINGAEKAASITARQSTGGDGRLYFVLALSLGLGWTNTATAQRWIINPSVETQATLTNNANYDVSARREGDLIFNVLPAVGFAREGPRLRVDGAASLNFIGYADGTQTSRVLPQANILANLEAIDRLFYIEGALRANQELVNPFLPRSDAASTFNKYTYTQARIAPYLQGTVGDDWRYLVRSDNSYTSTSQTDVALNNAYFGRHLAEVVRNPTPLGASLRVQSDVTRFDNELQPDQTLDSAIATVNYAFTPQLSAGLRGGYERTNYTLNETSGSIYGIELEWALSPYTRIGGFWESRFFGPSYQFSASNRLRRLATSLSFSRSIATYPQLILQLPATGNVSGLLNAILTARFPDPIERAQQVQNLITAQALPESLPGAVNIYSESPNVLTSGSGTVALIGTRNTLAFNLFYLKTERLPDPAVPPTFLTFNNTIQRGASLSLSHRLSPVTSLNASASRRETRGFDQSAGTVTDENILQVQASQQLSPRSNAFVGARYRQQDSTVGGIGESSEAAIFVGLFHRF
ncbi:MAG TPA: TIGR03016 family PEP-CTERM system-associated outer membrane protein [Burkholderiaceae bacterium]|nr:TIGR03016 family PEP-CTERM system-associated outer membrane protein [Burkholderiaceae bacterium]